MNRAVPLGLGLSLQALGPALAQGDQTAATGAGTAATDLFPVCLLLVTIFVLTGVLLVYVWGLRDRTSAAISAPNMDGGARSMLLNSYYNLPLGVPRGSVRAVLALVIVVGSIAFLSLATVSDRYKFPESLTGILGAILGFYFGKSGSDDEGDAVNAVVSANADAKDAIAKAADAKTQADQATQQAAQATQDLSTMKTQHDALAGTQLDHIQAGLQTAADIGKSIAAVLPGPIGTEVSAAAGALSATLSSVNSLRSGDLAGAVQKAGALFQQAAPNMPVVQVLSKAAELIGPVLGSAIPPVALLTTLVSVGTKLSAAVYARWVARIMDAPYTPDQFSPTVFDSNAAVSLIMQVPTLLKVFGPKLKDDRSLALDVARLALSDDGGAALFDKYSADFAGLDQPTLDTAVRDLQKAALDSVLMKELPADSGKTPEEVTSLLRAVDTIRSHPEASAGLDAVLASVRVLRGAGKNPETEFNKAAQALTAPGSPLGAAA